MKHYFPQYLFKLLKDASGPKKDPRHYDPTIFAMRLNAMAKEAEKQQIPGQRAVEDGDVLNVITTANAEHALWRGKGVHLFIDPDTESVIVNAMSKMDNATLARYRPSVDIGILYREGKEPVMYNFASENHSAASVNVESMGVFRVDDLAIMGEGDALTDDDNLRHLRDTLRFVCGCFMMAECFPNVFKDGLPDYVKHPNWFKKLNVRSISVARVKREVCPHIRSGHFRLLSSDRYVHKKGQVVFVKPSMIKGKAKHTELEKSDAKKK